MEIGQACSKEAEFVFKPIFGRFYYLIHDFFYNYQDKMIANPCGKLERLVSQLFVESNYKKAIEEGLRRYKINCFNITSLRPNTVLEAYYQISDKFYNSKIIHPFQCWHENQLKIYIWLLVGYAFLHKRCISHMTDDDWIFFSEIFKHHKPILLEYQALHILKNGFKSGKWIEEEIAMLKTLINKRRKNMWNDVARNLYVMSERKYFRTAKQCRQYWINHLDPTPVKTSWSFIEDYNLIQWVYLNNKKWAKVSKLFKGKRTEHMVKNRFNSLYHFELKKYSQHSQKPTEQQTMQKLKQKLKVLIEQQQRHLCFMKTNTDLDNIEAESIPKPLSYEINNDDSHCHHHLQSQIMRKGSTLLFTSNPTPQNNPLAIQNIEASPQNVVYQSYSHQNYHELDNDEIFSYFNFRNQLVFSAPDFLEKNQQHEHMHEL